MTSIESSSALRKSHNSKSATKRTPSKSPTKKEKARGLPDFEGEKDLRKFDIR